VFNIQEKITVHFHTHVYIHTGQAQRQYCKWGSWGGGQQSPLGAPFHQLGDLGERCKLPPAGSGAEPRRPTDFSPFGVPRTALLRNMRPLSMCEAPRPGGTGGPSSDSGAELSLPEKYFDSARKKTVVLICKITLPDSPHAIIPDFGHFISLDEMTSVFFRLINPRKRLLRLCLDALSIFSMKRYYYQTFIFVDATRAYILRSI